MSQTERATVPPTELVDERGNRLRVLPQRGEAHRVFKRRGVRPFAAGGAVETAWLVAELDGVRAYVDMAPDGKAHVVLTRFDLNP